MKRRLLIFLLISGGSAAAGTAHIYNLTDGGTTILKYSRWHGDHGPVTAKMTSGEAMKGEYSITRGGSASRSLIFQQVSIR